MILVYVSTKLKVTKHRINRYKLEFAIHESQHVAHDVCNLLGFFHENSIAIILLSNCLKRFNDFEQSHEDCMG